MRALAALAWTAVLTLLTLMPGKDLPDVGFWNADKVAHLGAFGVMAALYLWWSRGRRPIPIAVGCAVYGVLIEIAQGALTADRSADSWDALANALGCLLAVAFFRGLAGVRQRT